MKIISAAMISVCVFMQASLALSDEEIVTKVNKEAGGSIAPAMRCGAFLRFVEENKEALDRAIEIEANASLKENAKPVVERKFGLKQPEPIPADEELLEMTASCPNFQTKYRYLIASKQHKHHADQTKNVTEDTQKKIQSLEERVKILEGLVGSLMKVVKK